MEQRKEELKNKTGADADIVTTKAAHRAHDACLRLATSAVEADDFDVAQPMRIGFYCFAFGMEQSRRRLGLSRGS